MSITAERRTALIAEHAKAPGDTGSPEVQVALLSERIGNLTEQLAQVCSDLASHPILSPAPAVNALGFSQGGQFLRGFVER